MQKTIKKRDGRRVKFNSEKITKAIEKAGGSFEKVPTPLRKSAKDIESDEK